jgi:hypothetical protein
MATDNLLERKRAQLRTVYICGAMYLFAFVGLVAAASLHARNPLALLLPAGLINITAVIVFVVALRKISQETHALEDAAAIEQARATLGDKAPTVVVDNILRRKRRALTAFYGATALWTVQVLAGLVRLSQEPSQGLKVGIAWNTFILALFVVGIYQIRRSIQELQTKPNSPLG